MFSDKKLNRLSVTFICLVVFFSLITGCASVNFVDEDNEKIGYEYYPPKPYLVIEPDKDGKRKARIFSVPDLSKPRRIVHKGGWGTLDFSFKVTDAMLTEFGGKFDSKGPETITAVTGGVASLATSASTLGVAFMAQAPANRYSITSVIKALDILTNDVLLELNKPEVVDPGLIAVRNNIGLLNTTLDGLKEIAPGSDIVLAVGQNRKAVGKVVPKLEIELGILEKLANVDKNIRVPNQQAARVVPGMKLAIRELKGYVKIQTKIELYEIIYDEHSGTIEFELKELY